MLTIFATVSTIASAIHPSESCSENTTVRSDSYEICRVVSRFAWDVIFW